MKNFKRGTIVETTQGKIGEVFDSEGFVIKNTEGVTVSEVFEDYDVCDAYRMEVNPSFTTEKVPCLVKLGKNFHPIYAKNLKYIPIIYFKFKDYEGNIVHLKQNQTTAFMLKRFLDKSNIKYTMYSKDVNVRDVDESEYNNYNLKMEELFPENE